MECISTNPSEEVYCYSFPPASCRRISTQSAQGNFYREFSFTLDGACDRDANCATHDPSFQYMKDTLVAS